MKFRYSLMKYAEKYGVTRASRKYNKAASYIYFWKARYDGSIESLACRSRRPHSHPNQHTEAELKLIRDMRRRNPKLGIVELWSRLRKRGYSRCIESLWRVLRREGLAAKEKSRKKYTPKPYEQMQYPGQRVQILHHGSGTEALSVYGDRRILPIPHSGSLSRTEHLFLRTFPAARC